MCSFVFVISLLLLVFELWEGASCLWPYPGSQGAQMEATCFTDKQIGTICWNPSAEGFPWRVGLSSFCLYLRKVLLWIILQIHKKFLLHCTLGFPGVSECKESVCNAGDPGSIPESGRFPGEGKGNPLQYSCLENSVDRGVWQAIVHGGHKEPDMTEWLNFLSLSYRPSIKLHVLIVCLNRDPNKKHTLQLIDMSLKSCLCRRPRFDTRLGNCIPHATTKTPCREKKKKCARENAM